MSRITAAITAVGAYVPEFVLSNQLLESMVETNDEWITSRTGIKERRILKEKGKGTSFMAIKAAKDLLAKSKVNPEEIDLVILATTTPDMLVAATGVYVASQIGAANAFAYDLQAACSSFLYGMSNAAAYIESGRYKKVLLIGADKMSSIIDYTDRATCIIFGDGAGAVLFEPNYDGLGLQDEFLKLNLPPTKQPNIRGIQIKQIHPITNEIVKLFVSYTDIQKELKISVKKIKELIESNEIYKGKYKFKLV